ITECRKVIIVDEKIYSNADLTIPLAPSDTVNNFIDFLERNRQEWGFAKDVFIDSADQATITELKKYKRLHSSIYNFIPAYKKTKIIDRIKLQLSWLHTEVYLVLSHCAAHVHELEIYSWREDKDNEPEDGNDHTINASQYGWLPYKMLIGDGEDEVVE
ncbi:terminase, partial [Anaerovorax odorimutans]|nr:terminase [Anaerovorax odorimutans]